MAGYICGPEFCRERPDWDVYDFKERSDGNLVIFVVDRRRIAKFEGVGNWRVDDNGKRRPYSQFGDGAQERVFEDFHGVLGNIFDAVGADNPGGDHDNLEDVSGGYE